jgi:5'(3')-deoxyribonucleotidase
MKIAIDIDGPVADLTTAWLALWNRDNGQDVREQDIHSWEMEKYTGEGIYSYLTEELYNSPSLLPVYGADYAIQLLEDAGHKIMLATAAYADRRPWLTANGLGLYDLVCSANKGLVDADILIDDYYENCVKFVKAKAGRRAILWTKPWNIGVPLENDGAILRTSSWINASATIGYLSTPPVAHETEIRAPAQVKAFREIIEKMYSVHLDKNADYSPANILGAGEIGIMTRVWDKVARLMNLMGFRLNIEKSEFATPKMPREEAVEDSILDLAVYAIIWLIYRQGSWGK